MAGTAQDKKSQTASRSPLRRLEPACLMPTGAVLRHLTAAQTQRLRRRLTETIECVLDRSFTRRGAEKRFDVFEPIGFVTVSHGTPENPRTLRRSRLLTAEEESERFLRYNYARYRSMKLLESRKGQRLNAEDVRELFRWEDRALETRDQIAESNLGLVPKMVERFKNTGAEFSELISEGQMALLRAIEKFDTSRGFKFSTYACRAIFTSVTRAIALMARHRTQFPTEFDPGLQRADVVDSRRAGREEDYLEELSRVLRSNAVDLTRAEKRVLIERFGVRGVPIPNGLDAAPPEEGEIRTLREVAARIGLTKERVRQIQNNALEKLRGALIDTVETDVSNG